MGRGFCHSRMCWAVGFRGFLAEEAEEKSVLYPTSFLALFSQAG